MKQNYQGWAGRMLRVDLTRRTTSVEDWDRSWIGGKGFGQWALFNEEPLDCEEFDSQRMLIFSSGPLNGTIAPSCSRLNISSRNLLTGGCVEPVFGQVKFNLGFGRFRLSGLDKAGAEWTLVCLVHNVKKIYANIMAKGGDLDSLTEELEAVYNPA